MLNLFLPPVPAIKYHCYLPQPRDSNASRLDNLPERSDAMDGRAQATSFRVRGFTAYQIQDYHYYFRAVTTRPYSFHQIASVIPDWSASAKPRSGGQVPSAPKSTPFKMMPPLTRSNSLARSGTSLRAKSWANPHIVSVAVRCETSVQTLP